MSADKLRWMKFWPQDWSDDECLKVCSLAARGLWTSMICLMHKADPYGYLIINGKVPDARRLASVIGATTEKEVATLLRELESEGVFSRNEDGIIYSRRMIRDKAKSDNGKIFGATGGNPALSPNDDKPLRGGVKGHGKDELREGVVPTRAREAEAEAEAEAERESAIADSGVRELSLVQKPRLVVKKPRVSRAVWLVGFREFWDSYPNGRYKTGEDAAEDEWVRLRKNGVEADVILDCLRKFRFNSNSDYIHSPAKWLSEGHWKAGLTSDGMDPTLKAAGVTQAMLDEYLGSNDNPIFVGKLLS